MNPPLLNPWAYSAVLFIGLILCVFVGFKIGKRSRADGGSGALNGAVFGLLGLLLAFSFSGAAERFEHRRDLITEEANAVGTAYLRLDLLPATQQMALRKKMQQYLQTRLETYQHIGTNTPAALDAYQRSIQLQQQIWTEATRAAQHTGNTAILSLVSRALNAMFDITTTRLAATRNHPPIVIEILLFALSWISALLAGYGMTDHQRIPWLQVIIFSAALTITIFVIRDLEYPRLGFIRVDSADHLLVETLQGMQTSAIRSS
ncbi:DUF4239 domain-containing protein [Acidithiobacillus sp. HP-6]|uniref:bestrophin-like domain n=1 Tax=unclassified Acidithiobacillus TaxID=2614800 RepID=UPI00187A39FE|nr:MULTISPECIES: DUF4239 domain-containing protein [unclassified Acidithiobacillus]MBE7562612.1 DUF4239 domain-containing protein [Acidithiobacillus sp. HP-6]MBE7568111.1 DUF4239 domain-containing protein [Acidithiobacillus sp. HP-2]MDD2749594.1 hypothetical protein [Acidithiobacillus sp.]MDD5279929.1 hypothetical protein [Acidithiobacillus sp.]